MNTEVILGGLRSKKKGHWFLISAALVLIIVLVFNFGSNAKGEDKEGDTIDISQKVVAYVETVTLGEGSSDAAKLERTAIFRSAQAGNVVAENTGRIKQVNFEIGDFVRQGQVLAVFDQSSLKTTAVTALSSASAGLEIALDTQKKTEKVAKESLELTKNARKIAKMQYENAKNDPTEDEDIAKRAYENAKDLEDQAEQNVKIQKNQAQLQVNGAKQTMDGARVVFEKTILRAPISGTVVSKNVAISDYITSGSRIAGVVGEGKLQTVVSLNADQISRIKIGDEVAIAIGKSQHKGKIVSLSTIAKTTNQRFDVKIETLKEVMTNANKTGKVLFSLALEEEVVEPSEQKIFFAPISSVNLGQRRSVVFILEEGKAIAREIEVGEIVGDKIEITKGVSFGEKLIIVNSRNLTDGQAVTTKKD
ncbi:HlyD family efflux transporter periplasmic adaptor subunit [bacterium]|mgnify:CR=1 FL=1|jgi:HlyD family secretion protein|nr:HlyD family efflux transporter periplasmic adaptor subunit [bacterium]MBT4251120.1 HlyD family efflux transporter periplasmic adaptor subunit [bacterium]MBT4598088.1 HlyD family efflux transporter periplasmic adaptor subunit [bacterium]MBT6753430.1 HlyD family efflux transporter periplasmic adaptor subunit [bacterium]MBT7038143.1 HlyD family efflux transporter periplasmic adaptor subunit [bacterium]